MPSFERDRQTGRRQQRIERLPPVFAIHGDRVHRVIGLPYNAFRVDRPVLVGLGIATARAGLVVGGNVCSAESAIQGLEFPRFGDLDPQMVQAGLSADLSRLATLRWT